MSGRRVLLQQAAELAQQYLDGVGDRPVGTTIAPDDLKRQLGGRIAEHGENPAAVIDCLAQAVHQGTVATQGGRYFGFVIGGSLPVATVADWLVSGWDQNGAVHVMSPFVAVVEQIASQWIQSLVRVPASWIAGFVTGGTMANFTALAAARHHVLQTAGWDVEVDGLFGAPPIDVVVSEEAHYSIALSLRILGLGAKRVHAAWMPCCAWRGPYDHSRQRTSLRGCR